MNKTCRFGWFLKEKSKEKQAGGGLSPGSVLHHKTPGFSTSVFMLSPSYRHVPSELCRVPNWPPPASSLFLSLSRPHVGVKKPHGLALFCMRRNESNIYIFDSASPLTFRAEPD